MALICIFLTISDAGYLFRYVVVICMSREKVYLNLLSFLKLVHLGFLPLNCASFLTYFYISLLPDNVAHKYFLPVRKQPFH